jgi:hypothetical protein
MDLENNDDVDVADELLDLVGRVTAVTVLLAEGDAVAELIHEAHHLITTATSIVLGRQTRALRQAEQIIDSAHAAWQAPHAVDAADARDDELTCREPGCHEVARHEAARHEAGCHCLKCR